MIINKNAGNFTEERLQEVLNTLSEYSVEVLETSGPGNATELAGSIEEGSYLIVYGGDGTINEVAQSIVNRNVVMVPLNVGTGSDFQKTIGALETQEIGEAIEKGLRTKIDVVNVTYREGSRYFVNIMEVGLGANVMKRVNLREKTSLDPFTSAVLHELRGVKNYTFNLIADEFSTGLKSSEIIVANCKYFGGGMLASPNSNPTDGRLEIHAIKEMNRLNLLMNLSKLRSGKYVKLSKVVNLSSQSVRLEGDIAPIEMDGEVVGHTPLKAEVIPGGISILGKISVQD